MASKLFVRRRDGRIEVKINHIGRAIIKEAFDNVLQAEQNPDHQWHVSLNGPIDPSKDSDSPLSMFARQREISTNAELAAMTVEDEFLNDAEAWAWLTTLQVALRSTVQSFGILDDEKWASAASDVQGYVQNLQQLLFELADVL